MSAFKILVTSQKGGVGKSTLAANLAAYLAHQKESVTLIDLDTQGSSSSWLQRAPSVGVIIQHHILPWEQGGNRPLMDARLHLRRASSSSDVVICDLTWTDSMADELLLEFDAVIVPTSVAEIELASTTRFLNNRRWVFDSKNNVGPDLMLCPSRVHRYQLENNAFAAQRFAVSFLLSPPILESQSARDCFETGYLMDLANDCGQSFIEFAKAVNVTREIRRSRQALNQYKPVRIEASHRAGPRAHSGGASSAGHHKSHAFGRLIGHSAVLGKHHLHKAPDALVTVAGQEARSTLATPARKPMSFAQNMVSGGFTSWLRFFKRSASTITKT